MINAKTVVIARVKGEKNMIYNIYFSPTGSTQKVTTFVAEQFGLIQDIDLSKPIVSNDHQINKDDLCIVGVPSFGGRVPSIAIERLNQIKGVQTPVVLIATFGNRAYEDTLLELQDTLRENCFVTLAAMGIVCEHSIMHQYGKGRPHQQDFEEILTFIKIIKERLSREYLEVGVPGNRPYREYHGIPLKPSASRQCTQCGLCAKHCPVQAIPLEHPNETDKEKCISCMRCIAVCPQQARKLNPILLAASIQKLKKACQTEKKNEFF